jgi:hypothetical protein
VRWSFPEPASPGTPINVNLETCVAMLGTIVSVICSVWAIELAVALLMYAWASASGPAGKQGQLSRKSRLPPPLACRAMIIVATSGYLPRTSGGRGPFTPRERRGRQFGGRSAFGTIGLCRPSIGRYRSPKALGWALHLGNVG